MPNTQLSAKYGANNSIYDVKEYNKAPKSKFDFSKKNFTTIDLGAIVPIDWFNVFPGDNVSLSIRYLLDTFPLEVPPMNNYYVRTHWYFIKMSALWKGWNTFYTRGRSGILDLTIPTIKTSDAVSSYEKDGKYRNYSCPNGLMDYLGIKPKYYENDPTKKQFLPFLEHDSDSFSETGYSCVEEFSVLPLMAYQKICRYNYLSPNLLQDNLIWFPEDLENHWYLDYSASNLSGCRFVPEGATMPLSDFVCNEVPTVDDNAVDLRQLRYAQYSDDYFTSAKPWLVRGKEREIGFDIGGDEFTPAFFKALESVDGLQGDNGLFVSESYVQDDSENQRSVAERTLNYFGFRKEKDSAYDLNSLALRFQSDFYPYDEGHPASGGGPFFRVPTNIGQLGVSLESLSGSFKLSANTLRDLLAYSVWQERNALTDGSYNQMVSVHWNEKPRAPEYAPMYIGGTTDMVSFGQVIQQSSSVSGSPLGTKAGVGSANGGSKVFDFKADDFGIIMGVMFIVPEVVYSQGVGHEWTDLTFDDWIQPEFANMGYQPIKKQELMAQGNKTDDEDLYGYQTRYAYLKARNNSVSGLFDLPPDKDAVFGPYVQARRFDVMPELSQQFVSTSPENLDRSFLSFSNLPAFKMQMATDVELIRALPYQSTPETFGF